MPLPRYEDWQAPWEERGEELDTEQVRKLVYNLKASEENLSSKLAAANETLTTTKTERDQAQSKVEEYETKDLSEVERLKRENEQLKASPPQPPDDLERARYEIALETGLTLRQAMRLQGTTREELQTDAEDYKADLASQEEQEDTANGRPPSRRPRGSYTSGVVGDDDSAETSTPSSYLGMFGPAH